MFGRMLVESSLGENFDIINDCIFQKSFKNNLELIGYINGRGI